MAKVYTYDIIVAAHLVDLAIIVNERIEKGWQPQGGPFMFGDQVCQAMVRFEDDV